MPSALKDMLGTWLSRPDALLLDVGARGERVLSTWRLVIAGLLFAWPLQSALSGAPVSTTAVAFAITVAWLLASVGLAFRAHGRHRSLRLPFVSSVLDIVIVATVMAWLSFADPAAGLNSVTLWMGFGVAIAATALRSDVRTSMLAGAVALVTTLAIIVVARVRHPAAAFVSLDFGAVTTFDLVLRIGALMSLTWVVAAAQHRARRLVEISGTDSLTGLPNRTWLLQRMPQLLANVQSDGGALTIALVDLDYLKQLNVEHGQQGGDRALGELAVNLRSHAEGSDWLVRLGGGEFALLARQPVGTTWERLDALRRMVDARSIETERAPVPLRISFSAGLAGYPVDGRDLSALLRVANRRLQLARLEGRNRVVARD